MSHKNRKLNAILEKIYHAGNHIKRFAVEESEKRMKKRNAYKELYAAIDELAVLNKTRREDD